VEIFNCAADSADLTCWQYRAFHNGNSSTPYTTSNLSTVGNGKVGPGDVLVLCHGGAVTNATLTIGNVDQFNNNILHNGNDAIALYNTCEAAYGDIFGDASSTSNFAKDRGYTRNCDVTVNTTFPGSNSTTGWTSVTKNTLSGFGSFNSTGCTTCATVGGEGGCTFTDGCVLISGYLEGSQFNKCVEIANMGCDTACLDNIEYRAFHNGNTTATYTKVLSDFQESLAPGDVIVICHPNADSITKANISTTLGMGAGDTAYLWSNILHNGNDALALFNFNDNSYCDIFGNIGEDSTWLDVCSVGDTARTFNVNLERNDDVCSGVTTDPANGTGFDICSEWSVDTNLNTTTGLGEQDNTICNLLNCGGRYGAFDKEKAVEGAQLNVFPNPAREEVTFEFMASESVESVVIEVFTITGVKVAQPFNSSVQEGTNYRQSFDLSGLPAGVYLYRFTMGDQVRSGKISVMK